MKRSLSAVTLMVPKPALTLRCRGRICCIALSARFLRRIVAEFALVLLFAPGALNAQQPTLSPAFPSAGDTRSDAKSAAAAEKQVRQAEAARVEAIKRVKRESETSTKAAAPVRSPVVRNKETGGAMIDPRTGRPLLPPGAAAPVRNPVERTKAVPGAQPGDDTIGAGVDVRNPVERTRDNGGALVAPGAPKANASGGGPTDLKANGDSQLEMGELAENSGADDEALVAYSRALANYETRLSSSPGEASTVCGVAMAALRIHRVMVRRDPANMAGAWRFLARARALLVGLPQDGGTTTPQQRALLAQVEAALVAAPK